MRGLKNNKTVVIMSVAILLILTVGESIKFPVSVYAITFGNMHGNVIDENNNALQEVKVVLYSSSGVLIGSQYTDENGFFRIALGSGGWKISLKKDGYVNVEISFTMPLAGFTDDPQNDPVNLEDIILKKSLRLTASVLTRVENPGDIVLFPFTISNIGDQPEEVNFLTQNSAGWATRILDQSERSKRHSWPQEA